VQHARSRSFSWPLLLLLFSLSVMLGTAWKAHQLQEQRHQTAMQLLHDYAAFGAWSYQQQLGNELQEVAWQVINPVMHRELHHGIRVPDAGSLLRYRAQSLRDCHCDSITRPSSYFSFTLGIDTIAVAGDSLSDAARRDITASLTRYLRPTEGAPRSRMALLGPLETVPSLVSYGLMPTERMDTLVYGFVFDSASLTPTFEAVLARRDLLPSAVSRGQTGREILALEVRDRDDRVLYRDPRWPERSLVAEERLPDRAGGLLVRMTVLPSMAGALVAGGFTPNEVPVLLGVVGLASLLAIVAVVQLRRENQLARIRSEFVASVSHELRTPLAQIRLFLDTLRLKRYSTDDQREWLVGHLARETTRLEHLVDNVLHFSRMERNGSGMLVLELVNLEALIRETAEGFAPLAQSRRVTIDLDLAPALEARVDSARLRQILLNLLDNAVKFGPASQRVAVRLAEKSGQIQLRVEDQGPGVPLNERETIWEPYYRGARAGESAVGGSGIGLAIVRDAVRRMGGEARVEDAPGGGAAFVVELPLAAYAVQPAGMKGSEG
jgi:signal transduction histidine kinase